MFAHIYNHIAAYYAAVFTLLAGCKYMHAWTIQCSQ